MLTKGMCADLAGHGITVNGIGPGYFATELTQALVDDAEFSDWVRRRTPAGRWGRLSDLVGPVLFLCSPAAGFVNGQILYVDGGMLSVL
jgi:gluconate 5-dehydrogenase